MKHLQPLIYAFILTFGVNVGLYAPKAFGYHAYKYEDYSNEPNPLEHYLGHNRIIMLALNEISRRAQQSLTNNNINELGQWPLFAGEIYRSKWLIPILNGSYYADHTGSLNCRWDYFFGENIHDCDTIHHYGEPGNIRTVLGVVTAHTGNFASAFYTEVLWELGLLFWPLDGKPILRDLPYMWAGKAQLLIDSENLGNSWVGGFPFCEKWVREITYDKYYLRHHQKWLEEMEQYNGCVEEDQLCNYYSQTDVIVAADIDTDNELSQNPDSCPKWPYVITGDDENVPLHQRYKNAEESIENALFYLGWAIHIMQDITVPQNADNIGDLESEQFEEDIEQLLAAGTFDHLPTNPENDYKWGDNNYRVQIQNAIDRATTIEDMVYELIDLTRFNYSGSRPIDDLKEAEQGVDAMIHFTVEVIERFFRQLTLEPDSFEGNDGAGRAVELKPNIEYSANFHTPYDEDYYFIDVPNEYLSAVIDFKYDKNRCHLSALLDGNGSQYSPAETPDGSRITVSSAKKAVYNLHLQNFQADGIGVSCGYTMQAGYDFAELSPDYLEPNNTVESARQLSTGNYDELTIHSPADYDYYKLAIGAQDSFSVSITYNPFFGGILLYANNVLATNKYAEYTNSETVSISGFGIETPTILKVVSSNLQINYVLDVSIANCTGTYTYDCMGNCVDKELANQRIGDGNCDNGQYGMDLVCEDFDNDKGDCFNPNGSANDSCGPSAVYDCDGICKLSSLIDQFKGDGFCDDGSRKVNLVCEAFEFDDNDCAQVDDNHVCANAAIIQPGSSIQGSIQQAGEVDWYKIEVLGSYFLVVETTGTTDTKGELYGECGDALVSSDSDSGEGTNFQLWTLANGVYHVRVAHQNNTGLGEYRLETTLTPVGF